MTKTTSTSTDSAKKKAAPRGVISKLGQWFSSKRKKITKNQTETAAPDQTKSGDKKPYKRRRPARKRPTTRKRNPQAKSGSDKAPKSRLAAASRRQASQARPEPKNHQANIDEETEPTLPEKIIKATLLINNEEPEECRIALLENGRVESFYVETVVHTRTKGNIYKAKVVGVEPNLHAVFVDLGAGKNGFVPFSDIHPEYYSKKVNPDTHWKDINIEEVIKKGQELLVQVVKEPIGNKGANMTTFLSLPGRFLVLMPGSDSAGISKKIDSESQRSKLRKMIDNLEIPEGIGYIIRTASKGITKTSLSQDFDYLLNLWSEIKKKGQTKSAPALIYQDQNIISRFLRDHFSPSIHQIIVDDDEAYEKVENFINLQPGRQKKASIRRHNAARPIFDQFQVEKQIEQIYQPTVKLPSGGSIVINPTEALVAIDVNSGRTAKDKNFEETIFLANMEAAEELARQLRLRDLGGLIVVDFIDMRESRHNREVEKMVKSSMKRDKAKTDISRISKFGLMQISRQKLASPIQMGSYHICEHCQGRGVVRSVETQALTFLRRIQTGVNNRNVKGVECHLPADVAQYLLENKKEELSEIEEKSHTTIKVEPEPDMLPADSDIKFIKKR